MKLILTAAVDNLGVAGDVVEVKDGYGRNFLVPAWLRHPVDPRWREADRRHQAQPRRPRDPWSSTTPRRSGPQLEGLTIELPVRAGDTGKLFGAVTAGDVAAAIKKAGGPSVDKRAVEISKPIKTVGTHTVGVKLHDAVTAHVQLAVVQA